MKTISLTQPFATLVSLGVKKIETRSWATSYRGPLAIHAAKGYGKGGMRDHKALCGTEPFCSVLNAACKAHYDALDTSIGVLRAMAEHPFMPMGAIVATCELVDCVSTDRVRAVKILHVQDRGIEWLWTPNEKAFGDYADGRYAWLLANIQALPEPIKARGALGLWEWDADTP